LTQRWPSRAAQIKHAPTPPNNGMLHRRKNIGGRQASTTQAAQLQRFRGQSWELFGDIMHAESSWP
jgi:hypothetical protein